ncbi:YjcZ family sporulation protein [Halobacillus salinarum]|uniref:YjcZ family sporulation protein n=1 Tax=Halobacillus salinarum TaxID=2932257 RepID=A0ABY4EFL1_9BACI|nr:YjcZ family sporulation protein [Halobacillus salinarum]UOQ43245.1 YjcZ family sporulation protein [Halobacillus salinarum]
MYGYPYGGWGGCGRVGGYGCGRGYANNFALIVVLFILLIIVGAAFYC